MTSSPSGGPLQGHGPRTSSLGPSNGLSRTRRDPLREDETLMKARPSLLLALGLIAMMGTARGQTTVGCNNTGRQSDITGGTHDPLTHTCPVLGTQTHSSGLHGSWSAYGLHWDGPLDDALATLPASTSDWNPWLGLKLPSTAVDEDLVSVYAAHGPLTAVQLTASVTTRWPTTSDPPTQVTVRGIFTDDGRFEAFSQWPGVDPDGFPCLLEQRVAFDGTVLTVMSEDAPEGTAWLVGSAEAPVALSSSAPWARALMQWLMDPLALARPESNTWEATNVDTSWCHVSRTFGTTQQTLHLDLAHNGRPLRWERTANGTLVARRTFGEPLTVGDAVRPRTTVDETHFDAVGRAHEVTLIIREAQSMTTLPDGFGRVEPEADLWLVIP